MLDLLALGTLTAELLASHCGLLLAWRKGYKRVVLESDSTEVIDIVLGSYGGSRKDQRIIEE